MARACGHVLQLSVHGMLAASHDNQACPVSSPSVEFPSCFALSVRRDTRDWRYQMWWCTKTGGDFCTEVITFLRCATDGSLPVKTPRQTGSWRFEAKRKTRSSGRVAITRRLLSRYRPPTPDSAGRQSGHRHGRFAVRRACLVHYMPGRTGLSCYTQSYWPVHERSRILARSKADLRVSRTRLTVEPGRSSQSTYTLSMR